LLFVNLFVSLLSFSYVVRVVRLCFPVLLAWHLRLGLKREREKKRGESLFALVVRRGVFLPRSFSFCFAAAWSTVVVEVGVAKTQKNRSGKRTKERKERKQHDKRARGRECSESKVERTEKTWEVKEERERRSETERKMRKQSARKRERERAETFF